MPHSFSNKIEYYSHRINQLLDRLLPKSEKKIELLHEAMRYAVLSEGKRVRPLLVYAAGECLNIKKNLFHPFNDKPNFICSLFFNSNSIKRLFRV